MVRVAARSHSPSPRLMSRMAFSCGLTLQSFMLQTPRRGSFLAPPAAVIISRAASLRLALCFEDSAQRGMPRNHMGLASTDMKLFLQPKPGLLVKWGSAAWAQTQLTPGVSVLAAPRQYKARVSRAWRMRRKLRDCIERRG